MKNIFTLFICFWLFLPRASADAGAPPLTVVVGVPPYAYLAEKIGGGHLQIVVLMDQGQDPHLFEPGPKQVMSLGLGRIFFSAGLEFEQHIISKIKGNFTDLNVVDLSNGVDFGSNKNELDPHIWLSPQLLKIQAGTMADALSAIDPENRQMYQNNLDVFVSDLVKVRERIKKMLAPFKERKFYVFHPAFGHFGKDFSLTQRAVESGGRMPSPKELAALIVKAKSEKVKIVFVQPQFDRATAETIASAIAGVVVSLDPLAKDVLKNLENIAENLERAFK